MEFYPKVLYSEIKELFRENKNVDIHIISLSENNSLICNIKIDDKEYNNFEIILKTQEV